MKKIITLITLGLIGLIGIKPPLIAQSLATQSIGSSGFVSNQSGQNHINWHIGEVIIGHASGQSNADQGVYQYFDITSYNTRPDHKSDLFAAFPSPTSGLVHIKSSEELELSIISSDGVIVDQMTVDQNDLETNINHLPNGSYYLVARSEDHFSKSIKIILIK